MFVAGISAGDVSWPTSTQLPWRLAPVEGCCRASASFLGVVGQVSSGKSRRASLVGQDSSGKALRARLKEKVGRLLAPQVTSDFSFIKDCRGWVKST
ncbi:hypothetical protein DVH24_004667 [Malus domestica]|uniref:Uncharacterized protein n=1 Tax=Malus domestica TaxID=3750 RepID=A0A498IHP5_MALDO|nr:hypothetical protein DVH24_004667 [Malus domestica]